MRTFRLHDGEIGLLARNTIMQGGSSPIRLHCSAPAVSGSVLGVLQLERNSPVEHDEVVLVDALVLLAAHESDLFMSTFSVFAPESSQSVGMS